MFCELKSLFLNLKKFRYFWGAESMKNKKWYIGDSSMPQLFYRIQICDAWITDRSIHFRNDERWMIYKTRKNYKRRK